MNEPIASSLLVRILPGSLAWPNCASSIGAAASCLPVSLKVLNQYSNIMPSKCYRVAFCPIAVAGKQGRKPPGRYGWFLLAGNDLLVQQNRLALCLGRLDEVEGAVQA